MDTGTGIVPGTGMAIRHFSKIPDTDTAIIYIILIMLWYLDINNNHNLNKKNYMLKYKVNIIVTNI